MLLLEQASDIKLHTFSTRHKDSELHTWRLLCLDFEFTVILRQMKINLNTTIMEIPGERVNAFVAVFVLHGTP